MLNPTDAARPQAHHSEAEMPENDNGDIDLNDPRIKAVIEQSLAEATKGLKNKNSELLGKLKAAESNTQNLLEELGGEEGIESLKALREKFNAAEDAELVKKGDFDALINKRQKTLMDQFDGEKSKLQKQIDAAAKAKEDEVKRAERYRNRLASDRRESVIRREWSKHPEFIPEAVDDAVVLAEKFVTYDPDTDEYQVVDEHGEPRIGTDGKPVAVNDWLISLSEQKSYWVKPSAGGGAPGGPKGNPRLTGKTQSQMTREQRREYIETYGGTTRKNKDVPSFTELPQ